jgi:hypothetical protein
MTGALVPDARRPGSGELPARPGQTHRPVLTAVSDDAAYGDGVRPTLPRPEPEDAAAAVPDEFAAVSAALKAALSRTRPELVLTETRGPTKVAPYGLALTASVCASADDDREIAVGRLVLLHDPEGQTAWDGTYRIACFARADLDPEMSSDPMLSEVAWSWLEEALGAHDAEADALAGTVTITRSSRFGALAEADDEASSEAELRCSWTPRWDEDPARHLRAFCDLLADLAGLPPDMPGVVALSARRR